MQQSQVQVDLFLPSPSQQGDTTQNQSQMNVQTNVNLTRKKRIVFWIYLLAILLFTITITVLAARSWIVTRDFVATDSYYYSYQVAQDWKLGFIIGIEVLNGSAHSSCPAGYETAVNYTWPGASFGCYCNYSANLSFVLQGYCSPGLIQQGCLNLKNQPQFTVHQWVNASILCLKRSSVSFSTQQRYNGVNKICGSSQSLVIMPMASPCPYVNISFSPFQLQDHYTTVNDTDNVLDTLYVSYNSTSPYSFYSYPIAKFGISQWQFCQMDQDLGIDPYHSDYILLKTIRGCASRGNYSILNSQTEINFYQNNPKLLALTSIPGFPSPANWMYHFGFSSMSGWTYTCRHNLNKKYSIPKAIEQFSFTYKSTYQGFLIGVTICLIILLLQVVILTLRRIINNAVYPVGYKKRYLLKHFMMALSRYILDICVKLTLLGLALGNIFTIYTNYNWFQGSINNRCADSNIQTRYSILSPYSTLYNHLFNYALAVVIICIAMISIDIVHFIFIWRNELNYYLVETQDKIMIKKEDTEEEKIKELGENKDMLLIRDFQDNALGKDENDQFRITMAQNIFAREESIEVPRVKKKKKKRLPYRKKEEIVDIQNDDTANILQDQFNPYAMEEEPAQPLQDRSITKKSSIRRRKR